MLLLNNDEVEQALTPQDAIASTETIYRELAEGRAINRPRSQTYFPAESKEHPGFRYRFKSQEGSGVSSGVWALRITSDMAGFSYTAGVTWKGKVQPTTILVGHGPPWPLLGRKAPTE